MYLCVARVYVSIKICSCLLHSYTGCHNTFFAYVHTILHICFDIEIYICICSNTHKKRYLERERERERERDREREKVSGKTIGGNEFASRVSYNMCKVECKYRVYFCRKWVWCWSTVLEYGLVLTPLKLHKATPLHPQRFMALYFGFILSDGRPRQQILEWDTNWVPGGRLFPLWQQWDQILTRTSNNNKEKYERL